MFSRQMKIRKPDEPPPSPYPIKPKKLLEFSRAFIRRRYLQVLSREISPGIYFPVDWMENDDQGRWAREGGNGRIFSTQRGELKCGTSYSVNVSRFNDPFAMFKNMVWSEGWSTYGEHGAKVWWDLSANTSRHEEAWDQSIQKSPSCTHQSDMGCFPLYGSCIVPRVIEQTVSTPFPPFPHFEQQSLNDQGWALPSQG